ncbi:MAG: sodium ion-translocating decarboxylase subunit beta [Christensenellaceae bacterium]
MTQNLLFNIGEMFKGLWEQMGIANGVWQNYVMLLISFVLFYLAIVKKFEPLLLLPIAFGMFIVNVPGAYDIVWGTYPEGVAHTYDNVQNRGLLWYLFYGVDKVIYPPLIFLGIGAMTDFGPLISNPKSMFIGAAAQLGIFVALFLAICLGFDLAAACSIAIIGGADGPTAIYVTQWMSKYTSEDLLSAIAIAAYSYMALIPIIQKPLMRAIVPERERKIKMKQLRPVSKLEKIIFPILVTLVVGMLLPDALPLLGMLMLGNLLRESGATERLSSQAQNGLMNTVTIFLGVCVGSKAYGGVFLTLSTLKIIALGLFAFVFGTVGGLLMGRLMCKLSHGKINPLIGSAGVSAVPMAARISEDVGRESDPNNHLLMHAMGPNVAGVIGSAIAAGFLLSLF